MPPLRLRVALAAAPVLLAESLRSLLPDGVDVTIVLDPTTAGEFDLAIVTGDSEAVDAPIIIRLDDGPEAQGGGVASLPVGREDVHLTDLAEVLRFVDDLIAVRNHLGMG
jgi:hypothetical protein